MSMASSSRLLHPLDSSYCLTDCNTLCPFLGFPCSPAPAPSPAAPVASPFPSACAENSSASSPPQTQTHGAYQRRFLTVSTLTIAVSCLVAAGILLFLVAPIFILRHRRRRRLRSAFPSPPTLPDDLLFDDDGSHAVDHHVWYIRTVGLDEPTIASIVAFAYKPGDGVVNASDCPVCLAEFRDGELLRLLPKCGHAFHLNCIDTWLRSHVNCPLCRAPVVFSSPWTSSTPSTAATAGNTSAPVADPVDSNSDSSAVMEDTHMSTGPSNSSSSQRVQEDEHLAIRMEPISSTPSLLANPRIWVRRDSEEAGVLPPFRRSVSMGSLSLGVVLLEADEEDSSYEDRIEGNSGEELEAKNRGKQGSDSKESLMRNGALEMKRSLSSSGRKFFLSRYGRSRNAVLPL